MSIGSTIISVVCGSSLTTFSSAFCATSVSTVIGNHLKIERNIMHRRLALKPDVNIHNAAVNVCSSLLII